MGGGAPLVHRVRRLIKGAARRGGERLYELRYGVRTADVVYHEDLGLETDDRVWHDPSSWLAVRKALTSLEIEPTDVLADFGSGLGRVVLVASTLPFARVIGVEVSEQLNEQARANLDKSRARRRCGAIELVTTDATAWEIPPDLTVAYLYSPFTGEVFARVLDNLIASVDEHPRPLRVVYNYPVEHNRLLRSGRARVLDVAGAQWPPRPAAAEAIVTYQLLPGDAAVARQLEGSFTQRLARIGPWAGEHEPGFRLEKPQRLGGVVLDRPARD
jgi:Histone methylation protein DOT1